ncbi:MAG: RluA family pseudouridine synthase [Chloroflexi bacterium]|nr:RluA family pseudouridine synthase [Chloroflexota bacterium]
MYPDLSRSHVQKLITSGRVLVDGKPAKPSTRLFAGARIRLEIPPPQPTELVPEAMPIAVVYEDEDVIVVDKPAGLVVHPAPGHPAGTLVNALLARYPNLRISDTLRPGIVHRLDKDTSGLLVIARNDRAMARLTQQMKNRQVLKEYLALVHGMMRESEGVIDAPIGRHPKKRKQMAVVEGGRLAKTHFTVLARFSGYTVVRVRLETGRTHQIRVHFAWIGHPVAGDAVYGSRKTDLPLARQFLHAQKLGFSLPSSGEYVEFASPLPPDLAVALDHLRKSNRAGDRGRADLI